MDQLNCLEWKAERIRRKLSERALCNRLQEVPIAMSEQEKKKKKKNKKRKDKKKRKKNKKKEEEGGNPEGGAEEVVEEEEMAGESCVVSEEVEIEEAECSICYRDLGGREEAKGGDERYENALPCDHLFRKFHAACLLEWFRRCQVTGRPPDCPFCRAAPTIAYEELLPVG